MKEHNFTLTELLDMTPYQRFIYINIVIEYIKKKQKDGKQYNY